MLADVPEDWPEAGAGGSTNGLKRFVEAQLLYRITAGDRSALRTLYELYFPRLSGFFAHLIPRAAPAAVENLVNETLLEVWRDGEVFDPDGSIYVWIMRIALSHARLYCDPDSSGRATSWKTAMLAALSFEERAVMHLVYTGSTRPEVSQILGMPADMVDTLLAQARRASSTSPRRAPEHLTPEGCQRRA